MEAREGYFAREDLEAAAREPSVTRFLISSPFDGKPIPELREPASAMIAHPPLSKEAVITPGIPASGVWNTPRPRLYARAFSSQSSLRRKQMLLKLADLSRSRARAQTLERLGQIVTPSSSGAIWTPANPPVELESNSPVVVSSRPNSAVAASGVATRVSEAFAMAKGRLKEVGLGRERALLRMLGGEESTESGTRSAGSRESSWISFVAWAAGKRPMVESKESAVESVVVDGVVVKPLSVRKQEGGWV